MWYSLSALYFPHAQLINTTISKFYLQFDLNCMQISWVELVDLYPKSKEVMLLVLGSTGKFTSVYPVHPGLEL